MRGLRRILATTSLVALAAGANIAADEIPTPAGQSTPGADRTAGADLVLPPTSGGFDYQLGGAYEPYGSGAAPASLDVVVRDASAQPLPGAYSICYVNGFQTQPDEAEMWLDHPELLLRDESGDPVIDPDWEDEYVLDPSTAAQREGILDILGPVLQGCAEDGFDAVEIDNLDTWTRFDQIDAAGAQELAAGYVDVAHGAGLAIAQKNAAEITRTAHDELGFDFAVAEECGRWSECAEYTDVYGDHVLQIEYPGSLEEGGMTFDEVCALEDRAPLTILRDLDLVAEGEPGYLYESC